MAGAGEVAVGLERSLEIRTIQTRLGIVCVCVCMVFFVFY